MRTRLACVLLGCLPLACGLAPLPTEWSDAVVLSTDCDPRLWDHTYFAEQRLRTVEECIVVEGIVVRPHRAEDGDLVFGLRTDPRLVNRANEDGLLKIEAVCQYPGAERKHQDACRDYPGPIFPVPRDGASVRVTGRYVSDRDHNGHMEIHPVSRLEILEPTT